MRLMNVQSNVSIANLRALLQQCPETEPLLQDMGREKKKGQEPSPGCLCCGDSAVVIWHPPCSKMCLWSGGKRNLALLGTHKEKTLKIHQQSFPRTSPWRQ